MHLFMKQRIERRKEITKRAYKNLTLLSRSVITRDLILMHLYSLLSFPSRRPSSKKHVVAAITPRPARNPNARRGQGGKITRQASIEKGYARSSRSEIGHAMDWRVGLEKIRG